MLCSSQGKKRKKRKTCRRKERRKSGRKERRKRGRKERIGEKKGGMIYILQEGEVESTKMF